MKNAFVKTLLLVAALNPNAFAQERVNSQEDQSHHVSEESAPEPMGRRKRSSDTDIDLATGQRFRKITTIEWQRVFDAFANQYRFVQVSVEKWVPVENDPQPAFGTFFLEELGVTVKQFSEHGFEVTHVEFGSLGQQLSLETGDVLSRINGERVLSIGHLRSALNSSFEIEFFRPSTGVRIWGQHSNLGFGGVFQG